MNYDAAILYDEPINYNGELVVPTPTAEEVVPGGVGVIGRRPSVYLFDYQDDEEMVLVVS